MLLRSSPIGNLWSFGWKQLPLSFGRKHFLFVSNGHRTSESELPTSYVKNESRTMTKTWPAALIGPGEGIYASVKYLFADSVDFSRLMRRTLAMNAAGFDANFDWFVGAVLRSPLNLRTYRLNFHISTFEQLLESRRHIVSHNRIFSKVEKWLFNLSYQQMEKKNR